MKEFKKILDIADQLLGPNGCPWDKKQTFFTLQHYFIEECHELIEAINEKNDSHILEELGDLFYAIIFLAKLAEQENKFTIADLLEQEANKLIRRHPHVFGEKKAKDSQEVKTIWEDVKKKEKSHRKSALDGIPPTLPLLMRANKMIKRMRKENFLKFTKEDQKKLSEEKFIDQLFSLLKQAQNSHIQTENVLRNFLQEEEKEFREWERKKSTGDDLPA